jgi:hypothetical protein
MTVELVNAEVLSVGPDEVLIIRVPEDTVWDENSMSDLMDILAKVGLKERSFVIHGDAEFTKVKR